MSAWRKFIKTRIVLVWAALLALVVATGGCEGRLFAKKKSAQQVRQPVSRQKPPQPPAAAAPLQAPPPKAKDPPPKAKDPPPKAKDPKTANRQELDELLSIE